ncbi:MAG: alkaline phosphatase, partial [Fimbriimonadaceae bacterium]|nr:alkaline phosphatase [Fimbriimonadaceae bacterium]
IFSDSHIPYAVDRDQSPQLRLTVPTLAEMSAKALDLLDGGKGFLLQIEGEKVDHAGHANEPAGLLHEQLTFEDAVKVALDFAMEDGDTLVIVTADHGTGGPSLNGSGDNYGGSTKGLTALAEMKASFDVLFDDLGSSPSPALVRDVLERRLGIQAAANEAESVSAAFAGRPPFAASEFFGTRDSTLGAVVGNHSKIGWTSNNHTAEDTVLFAWGPGAELFSGLHDNTDMFDLLLSTIGVRFSNPTMSREEAARLMAQRTEVAPHWL